MSDADQSGMDGLRAGWAAEVGRFILAFGSIESSTYMALRAFPVDPIAQPLIDTQLALRPRIELLIAIARARAQSEIEHHRQLWGDYADTLAKIKVLASKRNLIAHNGVGIDVYATGDGEFITVAAISNWKAKTQFTTLLPAKDTMSFTQLVENRTEAERLEAELFRLTVALAPIAWGLGRDARAALDPQRRK